MLAIIPLLLIYIMILKKIVNIARLKHATFDLVNSAARNSNGLPTKEKGIKSYLRL